MFITININFANACKITATSNGQKTCDTKITNAVWLYTFNNVIPFGIGFDKETIKSTSIAFSSKDTIPIFIQFVNLFHKIINIILWFLVFLAFRNKFKL